MSDELNVEYLQSWVGKTERAGDVITKNLRERFIATVGGSPLGLHWCLAPPIFDLNELGDDGHPKKGGFLPPVPLRYRMWAAGETTFLAPLPDEGAVERLSVIKSVTHKVGKTGALVFVEVSHTYSAGGCDCMREGQTIVYKGTATSGVPIPSTPIHSDFSRTYETNSVLLFRYSALTFNGHRIHYDEPYARNVEGYSGLVVHGPLIATWLMQLASDFGDTVGGRLSKFSFRGVSPAICGETLVLSVCKTDEGLTMEARAQDQRLVMKASGTLELSS